MRKDYNLEKRKYVIGGFISLLVLIYVVRLFGLQVGDDKYKESADSNAFLRRVIFLPAVLSMTATTVWWFSTARHTK